MRLGKKLLALIMVMILAVSVVACGGDKEKSVTLTMSQNGVTVDYTLEAKGDKVTKIKQVTTMDCSAYSDEDIEYLEEMLEAYSDYYEGFGCAKYSTKINNDKLVETITIDTTDMDGVQELSDAGLFPMTVDNADYISLEKSIESLKDLGLTEK